MKVFFDTNIWVSAFAAAGLCETLVCECLREHSVLSSPLVGEELFRALDNKLKLDKPELKEAQELFGFASLIKDVTASRGNNDARLLIAAAGARADLFVCIGRQGGFEAGVRRHHAHRLAERRLAHSVRSRGCGVSGITYKPSRKIPLSSGNIPP